MFGCYLSFGLNRVKRDYSYITGTFLVSRKRFFAISLNLRGESEQMPCLPNVLTLFSNYLHEISFNPETLQYDHNVSSQRKNNKKGWGGGELMDVKKIKIVEN